MCFQILDNRQCRTGIPKGRETNEMSLTRNSNFLEAFSGKRHREEEVPAEHGGLTELKKQRSNLGSLIQLEFVWQSTREEVDL